MTVVQANKSKDEERMAILERFMVLTPYLAVFSTYDLLTNSTTSSL